jgi:hypothetical protein
MTKSRRMKWVGHVVHMGGWEKHIKFWWKTEREEITWGINFFSSFVVNFTMLSVSQIIWWWLVG